MVSYILKTLNFFVHRIRYVILLLWVAVTTSGNKSMQFSSAGHGQNRHLPRVALAHYAFSCTLIQHTQDTETITVLA